MTFGATEQVTNTKFHTLVDSATLSSIAQTDVSAGLGLVSIGTSAPSDTDQLWVDTSLSTYVLKHYDGTNWVPSVENQLLTNKSGQSLGAGVVVIIDTSNSNSVSVTSTEGNLLFGGINFATVANNAAGVFKRIGYVPSILLETSASAGCFLRTSTATGKATQCASGVAGIFGVVTQAGTASAAGLLFNSTTHLTTSASAASQAEMEAGTNLTNPVTPGRVQNHPGIAKMWVRFAGTDASPITAQSSYNLSGTITKNGTGDYSITFASAFSSSAYAIAGIAANYNSSIQGVIAAASQPSAAGFRLETRRTDTVALADFSLVSFEILGDQ